MIAGGFDFGWLDTAFVYDPSSEVWSPTASNMLEPRDRHQSARLSNGNVLLASGINGGPPMSSAEIYVIPDLEPPVISAAVSVGTSGIDGWYTSDVTVHFTCSDAGSGVAAGACPQDQILSDEGASVVSTAQTATDIAGNVSGPSNVVTVKIDKTAPEISAAVTVGTLGINGWYTSDVTVHFTCTDAGSGVAAGGCPLDQVLSTEGPSVTSTSRTVKDTAGNVSGPSNVVTVKIDKTAPEISAAVTVGTLGINGWYTSDVTVHFTCTDAGSGVAAGGCPLDQVLSTEGPSVTSTSRTVKDAAGNVSGPSNVVTVKIDKTAPNSPTVFNPGSAVSVSNAISYVVTGLAEPGSIVRVWKDTLVRNGQHDIGEELAAEQQLASGSPSFAVTVPLASGDNWFAATSTDEAGLESAARIVPPITSRGAPNAPDLTVSMKAQGQFRRGAQETIRITVTNKGNAATTSPIAVTATIPAGLEFLSFTTDTGTAICPAPPGPGLLTRQCTWPYGPLAASGNPGNQFDVLVIVRVSRDAGPVLTAEARVHTVGDPNTTNDLGSLEIRPR